MTDQKYWWLFLTKKPTVHFDIYILTIKSQKVLHSFKLHFLDAPNCDACEEALKHLEDIDDDADAVGVRMVKTEDKVWISFSNTVIPNLGATNI